MSLYDDSHLGQVDPYAGAATGFLENVRAAYAQQFRVDSFNALEAEVGDAWLPSIRAYERATGEQTGLSFDPATMRIYLSAALGEETPWYSAFPGGQQDTQARESFRQIDEKIKALNDPNVKSLEQVVQDIVRMRAEVTNTTADVSNRADGLGWLGGLVGGVGGSFTTRDPLYLLSAGFGGFGKGVAQRIATEMAVGASIETAQQFIGVQPTREMLGEAERSPWESIAYAAIGAGVVRGGLEGIGRLLENVGTRGAQVGDEFELSDAQLESMFTRVDTPTSRAGLHALESQQHFNALNPYTASDAGMRRFIGELSEVQQIVAGMTDTGIRQLPAERLPIDLDELSFEMRQVKETEPVVYGRFTAAQTRLDEVNAQIADVEMQMGAINEADGLARIDPDTAELARSYIRDLESPTATPAARETARRQLDSIAETIGVERIAKETADAAIVPRQTLKTLRQSRKAAMKEYNAARNVVDARIMRQQESARLKETMEQRKAAASAGVYAKANDDPYVGPLMEHPAVRGSFEAATKAQEIIPVAARSVVETPEGMIDLGEGKLVPADFEIEVDGKPMSVRAVLTDLDEDDKLLSAMGQCAL